MTAWGTRRRLAVIAITAGVAACLIGAANAQAETVSCGQLIDHSVVVDNDLTNCPIIGLSATASGITIDLNGHTIDGQAGAEGILIDVSADDVTVKNGRITQFQYGVFASGDDAILKTLGIDSSTSAGIFVDEFSSRTLVKGTRLVAWGAGDGILVQGKKTRLVSNGIGTPGAGGTGSALHLDSTSDVEVKDNTIAGSDGNGIFLELTDSSVLSNNHVCGNGASGAELTTDSDSNVFTNNVFCANGQHGVNVLDSASQANRLEGNLMSDNGLNGVRLAGPVGTKLVSNRAQSNGGSGISIEASADNSKLKDNVANYNRSFGFQISSQVTDQGGNRAKGNFLGNCAGPISC